MASSYFPFVIQNEGPHNPPEQKLSKFTCHIKRMNSSRVRDLAKGKLEDRDNVPPRVELRGARSRDPAAVLPPCGARLPPGPLSGPAKRELLHSLFLNAKSHWILLR